LVPLGCVVVPTVLWPLIRAVLTVRVMVAGPQLRDADGGVALETGRATGGHRAGGLIGSIQAVPVPVTDEVLSNALPVLAAELVLGAGLEVCGNRWKDTTLSLGATNSPALSVDGEHLCLDGAFAQVTELWMGTAVWGRGPGV
jgi:hypothetical protein